MKTQRHFCMSVEGPLRNWSKVEWKRMAKHEGITGEQLKDRFFKWHSEGKKVIPLGDPCEGFSYETGCPGNEMKDDDE